MSQQHTHFEETFRDGPPPTSTSFQPYTAQAGHKLVAGDQGREPSAGQRLALAIVSLVFVFVIFLAALGMVAAMQDNLFPIAPLAVAFALIFALVALLLNVLFGRQR